MFLQFMAIRYSCVKINYSLLINPQYLLVMILCVPIAVLTTGADVVPVVKTCIKKNPYIKIIFKKFRIKGLQ